MEHVNIDSLAIVANMENIFTGAQNGQCTLNTLSLASYGRNCPILRHTLQPSRQKCSGVDKSMPCLNHTEWGGIKQSQAQAPTPWGKPSQRSKVVQGCFYKEEPGGACRQQTRMHSHAKHQLASEGCKQKTRGHSHSLHQLALEGGVGWRKESRLPIPE